MGDWVSDFGRWYDNNIGRKVDHMFANGAKKQAVADPVETITKPINDFFSNNFGNTQRIDDPRVLGNPQVQKTATKPFSWPAGDLGMQGNYTPHPGMSVDDMRDNSMAQKGFMQPVTDQDRQNSLQWQEQQKNSALLDELLGQLQDHFGGLDKSRVDYGPLDQALKARMDNLNSIRGQTNQNYDKSDLALEQMHRAVQNEIATKGRATYQDIGNTEVKNLDAAGDDAISRLQAIKNEDMTRRNALLGNTGQSRLIGTADPNAQNLNEGISRATRINDADIVEARQDQSANEAYNQTVATSVGQQGVERRADLTQQLQQIMGRLGTVEAGYQNDYSNQKLGLNQRAEDQQYQQWRDRQGIISNTVGQMEQDARERDKMAQDMAIAQQKASAGQTPGGMGGLINDLSMSGFPQDQISRGVTALSDILGSDYWKNMGSDAANSGYTRSDAVLRELRAKGINADMALFIAQNLGNQSTLK